MFQHQRSYRHARQIVAGVFLLLASSCGETSTLAVDPIETLSASVEAAPEIDLEVSAALLDLSNSSQDLPISLNAPASEDLFVSVVAVDAQGAEPYVPYAIPADLAGVKIQLSQPAPMGGVEVRFALSGSATGCETSTCQGDLTSPDRDYIWSIDPLQKLDNYTVKIAAGETAANIRFEPLNDQDLFEDVLFTDVFNGNGAVLDESDETVIVELVNATPGALIDPSQSTAQLTILDNDYQCGHVSDMAAEAITVEQRRSANLLMTPYISPLIGGVSDVIIPLGISAAPTLVANLEQEDLIAYKTRGVPGSSPSGAQDPRLGYVVYADHQNIPGGLATDLPPATVQYFKPHNAANGNSHPKIPYGSESLLPELEYFTKLGINFELALDYSQICSTAASAFNGLTHMGSGNKVTCEGLYGIPSLGDPVGDESGLNLSFHHYDKFFRDGHPVTNNCEPGASNCHAMGVIYEFDRAVVKSGEYWLTTAVLGNNGQCIPQVKDQIIVEYH